MSLTVLPAAPLPNQLLIDLTPATQVVLSSVELVSYTGTLSAPSTNTATLYLFPATECQGGCNLVGTLADHVVDLNQHLPPLSPGSSYSGVLFSVNVSAVLISITEDSYIDSSATYFALASFSEDSRNAPLTASEDFSLRLQ